MKKVNKKNVNISVVYDNSYLGEGYFIILEVNGEIQKFLKFYQSGEIGFPRFFVRGYERGARDRPDQEFKKLEFTVKENENNELMESIINLGCNLDGALAYTIDPDNQGANHLSVKCGFETTLVLSKSVYRGKDLSSNFIDIDLGDNYSCDNYSAFQKFFRDLSRAAINDVEKQELIESILKLK